jgi:DNA-binding GntR family transcriptional regulator
VTLPHDGQGTRGHAVAHPGLGDVVAAELRDRILTGRLESGQRLVEAQIAEELGVSRYPVREALRRLEVEGLVVHRPRRGAVVAEVSSAEADWLLEARGALEELAAGLAARRRLPDQVEQLRDCVAAGLAAVDAGTLDELPALNSRFHATIATAAANPYLAQMTDALRDRVEWIYAGKIRARAAESWAEHAEIAEAIADGDADLARLLSRRHLSRARDAFHA